MSKYVKSLFVTASLLMTIQPIIGFVQAAPLKVTITEGQIKPTPIAITSFVSTNGDKLGQEIADIITNDLESSGLFIPINPKAFNQSPEVLLTRGPNFADWRMLNAQFLLTGSVETSGGQVRVQFRLFDVVTGTQSLGLELNVDEKQWRRLAHMVSDQVYSRVTGDDGYFNSQVVFIEETGPLGKNRVFRLAIMDQDGANVRYLTDGKHMVMTPRISPNNRDIAYLETNHTTKEQQVHVTNMSTGEHKILGKFTGMTHAPRFSPDGRDIVFSLEKNGTSAIYIKNLASGAISQITQHSEIDVSPCFSPDGQQIVFSSDRGGTPQLYVMNRDGSNVNRISFEGGKHFQPVWSPRGDLIACTRQVAGQFQIRVMRPDGTEARSVYAEGGVVESPTWSPNGRVLMFKREFRGKRSASTKLYSIDMTGRGLNQVKTPREASDGCWSTLLDQVKGE